MTDEIDGASRIAQGELDPRVENNWVVDVGVGLSVLGIDDLGCV